MVGSQGDLPSEKQNANGPTHVVSAQLPPKQQQSLISMTDNIMQNQNQQNSDPQTAMGDQVQQINVHVAPQGVQPAPQQQLTQQQQVGSQTNQQMQQPSSAHNISQQDTSGQNLQQHIHMPMNGGSQTYQQQTSQNFTPQISPPQHTPYTTNSHHAQTQQPQVLQQIPQQPLFQQQAGQPVIISPQQQLSQQQAGQQNVNIISPQQQLSQQHVVLQNQMMQHQQLQQYQQQLQQPIAMLQAPILYSNAPTTNSPKKAIKKGRFRVVKGAPKNEAKAALATGTNDNQSIASSSDAQTVGEKAPQPISTVKKGRFVVKKTAIPANPTVAGADAAKTGEKLSPQSSDVGKPAKATTTATDTADAGTCATVEKSKSAPFSKGNGQNPALQQSDAKPADSKVPVTKKKGRFLVKTGGSAANLAAVEAKSAPIAPAGAAPKCDKGPKEQYAIGTGSSTDELDKTKGETGDVAKGDFRRRSSTISATCVDATSQVVSTTKKKGRFVVKTGGSAASSPAGTKANLPAPEGVQNIGIGNAPVFQLTTPNPQLQNYIAGSIPINVAGIPTTSFVDTNGQMMVVSNVALPLTQTVQQLPLQQFQASQTQLQPQFVNPPVLNAASTIVSQQQHQPQVQAQIQPTPSSSDVAQPPPARTRAATEEKTPENVASVSKSHAQRVSRPAGMSGSSWTFGSRTASSGGKNGRLIGGGGVGKVLHHLDTLRSEVVEADRFITSLQSDNRFLRDKNKELEAKNKELQQKLNTAEAKCKRLRQQVRDQDINQSQTRPGAPQLELQPNPSSDGRLENWGSASFDDLQPTEGNGSDHLKQSSHKNKPGNILQSKSPAAATSAAAATPATATPATATSATATTAAIAKPPHPPDKAKMPTGADNKRPMSRNNSFDASDATRTQATAAHPTPGPNSVAKQFDPLGSANISTVHQTNGIAVAQSCILRSENVTIPLIVTAQPTSPPPPPPPPNIIDMNLTANASSRTKHFDPLGTPERTHDDTVPAIVINGVPQMPAMTTINSGNHLAVPVIVPFIQHSQQQQRNRQEDPFDEIVRMSHSNGTL